jgi:hypothetical protein
MISHGTFERSNILSIRLFVLHVASLGRLPSQFVVLLLRPMVDSGRGSISARIPSGLPSLFFRGHESIQNAGQDTTRRHGMWISSASLSAVLPGPLK